MAGTCQCRPPFTCHIIHISLLAYSFAFDVCLLVSLVTQVVSQFEKTVHLTMMAMNEKMLHEAITVH